MKEPVLDDPETDTLLVKIRPWTAASSAEINEEVGGEDARRGSSFISVLTASRTPTRSSMLRRALSWSPERGMRCAEPKTTPPREPCSRVIVRAR